MKAIHKKTGSEHKVAGIMGNTVTLESLRTGKPKRIAYELFKQQYTLVDNNSEPLTTIPSIEIELEEAKDRVEEVISEAHTQQSTVVKVSFQQESKAKEPKEPKAKADKPKAKKDNPQPQDKGPGSPVPLKDICDELKVDPTKARRILRKATNIDKPGGKWEWTDPQTINKIKTLLSK